ncbi:MAG: hypothetical protein ACKVIN_02280, partial [Longimicrobiales bacterium]
MDSPRRETKEYAVTVSAWGSVFNGMRGLIETLGSCDSHLSAHVPGRYSGRSAGRRRISREMRLVSRDRTELQRWYRDTKRGRAGGRGYGR